MVLLHDDTQNTKSPTDMEDLDAGENTGDFVWAKVDGEVSWCSVTASVDPSIAWQNVPDPVASEGHISI